VSVCARAHAGLVCLELYKVVLAKPVESFRNTFANLALPLFAMAEPMPPKTVKYKVRMPVRGTPQAWLPQPQHHAAYARTHGMRHGKSCACLWRRVCRCALT